MKTALVFLAIMAVAVSRPQKTNTAPALDRKEIHDVKGQYDLSYTTADGTQISETARLVPNQYQNDTVLNREGTVKYTSPEGITISYSYRADQNGYHVEGAHIPK